MASAAGRLGVLSCGVDGSFADAPGTYSTEAGAVDKESTAFLISSEHVDLLFGTCAGEMSLMATWGSMSENPCTIPCYSTSGTHGQICTVGACSQWGVKATTYRLRNHPPQCQSFGKMFLYHRTVQQLTALGGIKSILLEGLYRRLTEFKLLYPILERLGFIHCACSKVQQKFQFITAWPCARQASEHTTD